MNTNDDVALPARQMESLKVENLLINFTTEFHRIWDTRGSKAKPGAFWRPTPPPDVLPGFFPLGDLAVSGHDNVNGKTVMAVVCEGDPQSEGATKGKALSRPDDYEQVWKDSGSGSRTDGSIWRPIPPAGYVALGLVCSNNHEKPSLNAVRCVRADLVIASGVGDVIWDDRGSGAEQNFSAWSTDPPAAAAGEIYFAPGTFVGAASFSKPATHVAAYSLRMQIPLQTNPAPEAPVLMGFSVSSPLETSEATQIATIPWFAVEDVALEPIERLSKSPLYQLERKDQYVLVGYCHNTGAKGRFFKWTAPRVTDRTLLRIFTDSTSIKFRTEWPIETSGRVLPIKFSAKLSKSFSRTETSSNGWMASKSVEVVAIIPKNKIMAVYQLQSHYELLRKDGTQVAVNIAYTDSDSFYLAEYPPEVDSETTATLPVADISAATNTAP